MGKARAVHQDIYRANTRSKGNYLVVICNVTSFGRNSLIFIFEFGDYDVEKLFPSTRDDYFGTCIKERFGELPSETIATTGNQGALSR